MMLMLGLRPEREVRSGKVGDGKGHHGAGGMVGWDLRGERKVLGEANACGAAGTAASAVKRNGRDGVGERERRRTWLEMDQVDYKITP